MFLGEGRSAVLQKFGFRSIMNGFSRGHCLLLQAVDGLSFARVAADFLNACFGAHAPSQRFECKCNTLAAADAQGDDSPGYSVAPHGVQKRRGQYCAGCADGMSMTASRSSWQQTR